MNTTNKDFFGETKTECKLRLLEETRATASKLATERGNALMELARQCGCEPYDCGHAVVIVASFITKAKR